MALFSSGSVWNNEAPDDSGPVNTTTCVFERNRADEGGAIYSAVGYDIINDSWFEDNFAGTRPVSVHSGSIESFWHTLVPSEGGGLVPFRFEAFA